MVDELFDETKRDSAIGRIGGMLERYFDGDASKLALLLDPTRLNSPMHQFRLEIAAGFKGLEERLVAIEAAAAARGAERARSAAKGADFEDLLASMLGEHRPRRRRPARRDRPGDGHGPQVQEGRLRADHRRAGRARPRPAGRRRGQGPPDVDARDARRAARGAREPGRVRGGRRVHAGPCPDRDRAVHRGRWRRVLRRRSRRRPSAANLEAAVRLARLLALATLAEREVEVDAAAIETALTAIREQLEVVRALKSQLTSISNATKAVWTGLDTMRSDILARVTEAEAEIRAAG